MPSVTETKTLNWRAKTEKLIFLPVKEKSKKKKKKHTSAPEEKPHGLQPNQNVTVVLYCAGTSSVCAPACVCECVCF